jgi:hypothetical protein
MGSFWIGCSPETRTGGVIVCPSSKGMIRRSQRRIIVMNDFEMSASNTVPAFSST